MTRLHDAFADLAGTAPEVDLAEGALKRARRRRGGTLVTTLAATATATAAVAVVVSGIAVPSGERGPERGTTVTSQVSDVLPDRGVAPVTAAYAGWCRGAWRGPCADWRVVTADGRTYRVPQVIDPVEGDKKLKSVLFGPLAVSLDGRRIVYQDRKDGLVARDLASGSLRRAPVRPGARRLVLSPDGRYVAVAGETSRNGMLIDIDTGAATGLPDGWSPLNVTSNGDVLLDRNGAAMVIDRTGKRRGYLARGTTADLRLGAVAADGRTVAGWRDGGRLTRPGRPPVDRPLEIVTLDAPSGRVISSVTVRRGEVIMSAPGHWLDGDQVRVLRLEPRPGNGGRDRITTVLAVDVRTGKLREIGRFAVPTSSAVWTFRGGS
ncbi:hypothetical protein Sru01_57130 [Sphaerisporangium rufum]|uniref:Uncharacterized protein n=1 Tax=Sphaerisporangium rufum TaxID=1381558 RepID=A0A919R961_9ACTN|nr:hypothetical protein [Sphaerisporangium rufum]GII80731.1 hypothetical protein Sru01_57130 [Sphaerisporangium rufum]